jgi:release factor glutamine methyltransferase
MPMLLLVNKDYTLPEIIDFTQNFFLSLLSKQEIWWVLEKIFDKSQVEILASSKIMIEQKHLDIFLQIKNDLISQRPLAFIIGHTKFCDLKILTQEPILIPRPETEEWCIDLIKLIKKQKINPAKILDIGTGTGCLALALKSNFPEAKVTASDINDLALKLARENAIINNLSLNLINSNVFENINDNQFDLIVSNPPYISEQEYLNLKPNVLNFEDKYALTTDDEGLKIIKKIINNAQDYLNKNGLLVIEIDRDQKDVLIWAYQQGFKYGMYKKDFNDQARVIFLSNNALWNLPQLNFITGK